MSVIDKVGQIGVDGDLLHNIVHGGPTVTVATDGGPVRSLAKVIADNDIAINASGLLGQVTAGVNAAAGSATTASTAAGTATTQAGIATTGAGTSTTNALAALNSSVTATTALVTATAQAVTATSQSLAAQTAAVTATAANTSAQLAANAALIGAGVYVDEPTGRAAVANGAAFKTQGSGNVAAYEYRRVAAGSVSTLIATYPSASALATLPGVHETLDTRYRDGNTALLLDGANKIVAKFPDPSTLSNAPYETIASVKEVPFLDAAGKVIARLATRASVSDQILVEALSSLPYETISFPKEVPFIDAAGKIISNLATRASVSDQIAAEAGTAASTARLNNGLTPYGDVLGPYANKWSIRDTRMRLRKLATGDAGAGGALQYVIGFIGDSYTHGGFFTDVVAKALQTQYGFAGSGWTGFGGWFAGTGPWTAGNQPTGIQGNVRPDLVPAPQVYGNWVTSSVGSNNTPSLESAASSTVGDYVRFTKSQASTVVTLFYCGDGTGVVQVSFDDGATYGANVPLSTVGAANVVLTSTPSQLAIVRIQVVSGNVKLAGVNQWSYAPGVIVHKLGWSGSAVANWTAADATLWATQLAALACNAHVVMFGTNDQGQVTPAVFAANLGTLCARIRSILPYGDLMISMPPENNRTNNPTPMPQFAQAAREYAVPNDIAFLDLQYFFGSPTNNGAAYANANANRPWYGPDLVHPAQSTGGRVIADAVLRLLTSST